MERAWNKLNKYGAGFLLLSKQSQETHSCLTQRLRLFTQEQKNQPESSAYSMHVPMLVLILFSLALTIIWPATSHADIYKYVDANGKVFFTDKAINKKYKRVLTSRNKATKHRGRVVTSKLVRQRRKKVEPIVARVADKHQLDPKLLHAIILAESAYDHKAVSSAGAVGLMQLMPATAKQYGVTDRRDPVQSIEGGARYLKKLLVEFKSKDLAVAAYNAGEGAVHKYGNRIPPYKETVTYVERVMKNYQSE